MIPAEKVREILQELRKLPYIQLMVRDWISDEIAGCSLAAQGLWLRLMFIMHGAPLYGHLADATGKPMADSAIMKRCGIARPSEYRRPLDELLTAGVPRLSGNSSYLSLFVGEINDQPIDLSPMRTEVAGVLYSRRMVSDHRLRVVRRLAGALGSPTSQVLGTQRPHQKGDQIPVVNARARAEDEDALDSSSRSREEPVGVQGEGQSKVTVPDFAAVARIEAKVDASALRTHPPQQIVGIWQVEYGEDLIYETLSDCEGDYTGKHWKYLEQILTSRRNDPSQRPGKRKERARGNGNGRGSDYRSAAETRSDPSTPRPDFGHRDGRELLRERRAAKELQALQSKPPA